MQQPSAVTAGPSARSVSRPLSTRLWDLKWKRVLPWTFEEVSVDLGVFDDAIPFIQQHYGQIFGTQSGEARFLTDPLTETKRRFGAEMDVFFLRAPEGTIGVVMGHPTDWTTYYIRSAAFLPEYRARHFGSRIVEEMYEPLREVGVERLEVECSPANLPMMRMMVGQGFMMTSTVNSERWGYMARFTRFLREEGEAVFLRQYCAAPFKSAKASPPTPNLRRKP